VLALFGFSTVACGALLALEPLDFDDGGTRDGGGPDALAESGADVTLDGRADDASADVDAGPSVGFCESLDGGLDGASIVFCDDFERAAPLEKLWVGASSNGGQLSLSTGASVSGTRSLLVEIPAGASAAVKEAFLTTPSLPNGAGNVTVEMDVRIDVAPAATGSYPSNGFVFGRSYHVGGGFEAAFITVPAAGTFNPGFLPADPPPPTPFVTAAWHHFTWRIVNPAITLEVKPKAGGDPLVRTDTRGVDPQYFRIGAETEANLGPVKMFIDDIVMYR